MKRQKINARCQPSYPSAAGLNPKLRNRLVLLALLVLAPIEGCFPVQDTVGLVAVPHEEWEVVLPAAGARTLTLDDEGHYVTYRVAMIVNDPVFASWLEDNGMVLIDRIDEVLLEQDTLAFAIDGEERADAEDDIQDALMQAYAESDSAGAGGFWEVELVVNDFDIPEEDDTGDLEDTGDTGGY